MKTVTDSRALVIDLRYPREHAHTFPIKGSVTIEADIHTPSKTIEACTTSNILHQLRTHNIITSHTRITSAHFQRIPSPEEYTVVTIHIQDNQ